MTDQVPRCPHGVTDNGSCHRCFEVHCAINDREGELRTVNAKLDELYWIYTRCAKGRPPALVAPELYARRRELEREIRDLRRSLR